MLSQAGSRVRVQVEWSSHTASHLSSLDLGVRVDGSWSSGRFPSLHDAWTPKPQTLNPPDGFACNIAFCGILHIFCSFANVLEGLSLVVSGYGKK